MFMVKKDYIYHKTRLYTNIEEARCSNISKLIRIVCLIIRRYISLILFQSLDMEF